jgi:hypothetical protein
MTSIDKWTGSLKDDITDTKEDFHEGIANTRKDVHKMLDYRNQGTQVEIEGTQTLVDTTRRGLRPR